MKHSEAASYRKNLVETIQKTSDRDKKRKILEKGRNTEQYQESKAVIIAERRQQIEEQCDLREGETKETILNGVTAFTREVLKKYPQISKKGKLNYYFSGSLGMMLFLQSKKFEVIDETRIPEIVTISEKEIPPEAKVPLEKFVRKIGDLDYVHLEEWKQSGASMRKGGGGPQLSELSERAKKALKIEKKQFGVACDPLSTVTPHRVVRVPIDGTEAYISEPKMMLAYKAVHLGQSFEHADKTDTFVSDFSAMINGIGAMCLVPGRNGVQYRYITFLPQTLWDRFYTNAPRQRNEFEKKYKNLQRAGQS